MSNRPYFLDKNFRPVEVGDVLKVFHFVGARRKKYFMYKVVGNILYLGKSNSPYFSILHLPPKDNEDGSYLMAADEKLHADYEIVQGYGENGDSFFDERKRKKTYEGHN